MPDDRLLIESDSPYLAPVPFRGKRNEPAWCRHTLERLAHARGAELEALGITTAANTRRTLRSPPSARLSAIVRLATFPLPAPRIRIPR